MKKTSFSLIDDIQMKTVSSPLSFCRHGLEGKVDEKCERNNGLYEAQENVKIGCKTEEGYVIKRVIT